MMRRFLLSAAGAAILAGFLVSALVASTGTEWPVCLSSESLSHGDLYITGEFQADPEAVEAAKELAAQPGVALVAAMKEGEDAAAIGATRAVLLSSGDGFLTQMPVYLVEAKVSNEPYTLGGSIEHGQPVLVTASCSVVAVNAATGKYLFTFTDAIPAEAKK